MTKAKRLRLGIIGAGGIARMHVKEFLEIRAVEVVAMTEPDPAMVRAMKRKVLKPAGADAPFYRTHKKMLAKETLDAVLIASPHSCHYTQALDSLGAGCHVFMEKPMVTRVPHARDLVRRVEESDRVFALAHQSTWGSAHHGLRAFLTRGRAGELTSVVAWVAQGFWKDFCTGAWRTNPRLSGGGQLIDTGSHLLTSLLWLVDDPIVEVMAFINNRGMRVDIVNAIALRFKSGMLGTIVISAEAAAHEHNNIIFHGTRATVETGIWGQCVAARNGKEKPIRIPRTRRPSMQKQFIEVVRGERENPAPAVYGLRLALLAEAIYQSAKTGKAVRVALV